MNFKSSRMVKIDCSEILDSFYHCECAVAMERYMIESKISN